MSAEHNGNGVVESSPEVQVEPGASSSKRLLRRPSGTGERKLRTLVRPSGASDAKNGSGSVNGLNGLMNGAGNPSSNGVVKAGVAANGGVPGNGAARIATAGSASSGSGVLKSARTLRTAAPSSRAQDPAARPAIRPQPDAPQPSWLSTVRGKVICASAVGGVLLAAIGILLWIKSSEIDPQKVKEDMKNDIARVNALPAEKILEKDELLHSILENPLYLQYGADFRKGLVRSHEILHQSAEDLRKARDKVKPFLTRYQSLKARPDRLRSEAQRYYDESRALHDQFGSTTYGPKLAEVVQELEALLESNPEEASRTAGLPGVPGGSEKRG